MIGSLDLLRGRPVPKVNARGIYVIGSAAFQRAAALHEDGSLHVIKAESDAVHGELTRLRRKWRLPDIVLRVPATPVSLEHLYGINGEDGGLSQIREGDLEPGARRLMGLLRDIATLGASDLKILVRQDHADLRIKVGGDEITYGEPWPVGDANRAISFLFDIRAEGDGAAAQQRGAYQGFSIAAGGRIALPDGVVALRGQKSTIAGGGDMLVMRLLYSREANEAGRLEDLGLDDDVLEALKLERQSDSGLVIVGGSTGDGKSTTLVRQLERLYQERDGRVSIYTIEDPVEYPILGAGVGQMVVPSAARGEEREEEYSEALRNFVRNNPDIGMISEIRSVNDARAILQFVISGHKVFTTIHSFSANAVLFRLISLGVDPRELSEPGVVNLVMRQKIVPILCPDCSVPATPAQCDWIKARLSASGPDTPRIRNRAGCATCLAGKSGTGAQAVWGGVARRRAVAEFIALDDRYRGFVEARDARGAYAYWTTPLNEGGLGGRTVDNRAHALIAAGLLDYTDYTRDQDLPTSVESTVVASSISDPDGAREGGSDRVTPLRAAAV